VSLAWFVIAAVYFIVARGIASVAASGLASGHWFDFTDRAILLFLLIVGFAAMGYAGQRQFHPVNAMGLELRPGGRREFALGAAIGWAGVAVCALLIVIFGGLVVFFYTGWRQFALIPLDLAILLIASLAEEVAFRGYPFQRLSEATNPFFAMLVISGLYALAHITNPGASPASFLVTMFAGWLFTVAYLRTRALWMGWGIHFAWNASMAVLFGLPLSGTTRFSPVITSTAIGPTWLTGFDYGPEGSAVGIAVILALVPVTFWVTRGFSAPRASMNEAAESVQPPAVSVQQVGGTAGERVGDPVREWEPGPENSDQQSAVSDQQAEGPIITPPPAPPNPPGSPNNVYSPAPERQPGIAENPPPPPQTEEQHPAENGE
jgi:membrane protease YdiL (CAAX protease family)